jgi:hypothetical protein
MAGSSDGPMLEGRSSDFQGFCRLAWRLSALSAAGARMVWEQSPRHFSRRGAKAQRPPSAHASAKQGLAMMSGDKRSAVDPGEPDQVGTLIRAHQR